MILCAVRRWVCWRLDFRVRAVLGLCEVGVLGLERDGIVEGMGGGGMLICALKWRGGARCFHYEIVLGCLSTGCFEGA